MENVFIFYCSGKFKFGLECLKCQCTVCAVNQCTLLLNQVTHKPLTQLGMPPLLASHLGV